ncbi:MAG: ferritin-like domain-containing protein [Alphaproteobacteria bacterium]|nr:ferritin-like domain-containing protein [Alphaproteobacteria bacterium]
MGQHWTLDDVAWDTFDATKVDPDLLLAVKAAAMVERHSDDYVTYLCSVFHDDPAFQGDARTWGQEEIQHGMALRRWAELADPQFDFETNFERFKQGHLLPLDATRSVRGSRTNELVARCVVEVGTSSFYSALRDAADEPVLKQICAKIAGDEFRHYKLFYTHAKRYQISERSGLWDRLRASAVRLAEIDDDELAYAFYCGSGASGPYERRTFSRAYAVRAYPLYHYGHVQRGLAMVLKAVGIDSQGRFADWLIRAVWWLFRARLRFLERVAA